ncbi:rho GTPase-activating protein 21-like isoform X2 [Anneissia japonica]|uniref:rho GTPase-activating protein 21-like isoform X2 n=1 Tax=Anneissia japonica TaxID=1529436 RepID=UPI0014255C25|nr:rho GTPase-activating protein 21-like isoform X2 [Anneissia japonica]
MASTASDQSKEPVHRRPDPNWKGPRKVIVNRNSSGFGFTLRHFIVYPPESAVDELRTQELSLFGHGDDQSKHSSKIAALEPMDTIFVKQVKVPGPAHDAGLATGDRIISVNGESVTGKTYNSVLTLIQGSSDTIKLLVVPKNEDILQVAYPSSAYTTIPVSPDAKQTTQTHMFSNDHSGEHTGSLDARLPPYVSPIQADAKGSDGKLRHQFDRTQPISFKTSTPVLRTNAFDIIAASGTNNNNSESTTMRAVTERRSVQNTSSPSSCDSQQTQRNSLELMGSVERLFQKNGLLSLKRDTSPSNSSSGSVNSAGNKPKHSGEDQRRADRALPQAAVTDPNLPVYRATPAHVVSPTSNDPTTIPHVISNSGHSVDSQSSQNKSQSGSDNNQGHWSAQSRVRRSPSGGNKRDKVADINSDRRRGQYIGSRGRVDYRSIETKSITTYATEHAKKYVSRGHESRCDDNDFRQEKQEDSHEKENLNLRGMVISRSDGNINDHQWNAQDIDIEPTDTDGVFRAEPVRRSSEYNQNKPVHIRNPRDTKSLRENRRRRIQSEEDRTFQSVAERRQVFESRTQFKSLDSPRERSVDEKKNDLDYLRRRKISSTSSTTSGRLDSYQDEWENDPPPFNRNDRGRMKIRERSQERERQHEQWLRERHRSKSLERVNHRNLGQGWKAAAYARGEQGMSRQQRQSSQMETRKQQMETPKQQRETPKQQISRQDEAEEYVPLTTQQRKQQLFRRAHSNYDSCESLDSEPATPRLRRPFQFLLGRRRSGSLGMQSSEKPLKEKTSWIQTLTPRLARRMGESKQRVSRRTSFLKATFDGSKHPQQADTTSLTSLHSLDEDFIEHRTPPQVSQKPSQKRTPSIRKLKEFFGEGTPRIVEAASSRVGPESEQQVDIIKEGPLQVKVESKDGRRATDRSWKLVWGVLKGHALYLLKERREINLNPVSLEEQPISIKSAIVDIAYDYTKKKNVFRLCTYNDSEYLIQVADTSTMLAWITAIQANNNPDDDKGVVSQELILRKTQQHQEKFDAQALAIPPEKKQQLSPGSIRRKFGGRSSSPTLQHHTSKKPVTKEDSVARSKPNQKWAGKMVHKFKKISSANQLIEDAPTKGLTFAVPLEECPLSQFTEYVPAVVFACCTIIEERGLDTIGIYRVPGNNAGVSLLKDYLDQGHGIHLEDERWHDVHVISSLLKLFFRKLPHPIIPRLHYKQFIEANRTKEPVARMWALRQQIQELPVYHYQTFRFMAYHLKTVAANNEVNKMEARNLAIVFGPTLIKSPDDSMMTMVTDMSDQCRIVETVILHCDWFFCDDTDSQEMLSVDMLPASEGVQGVPDVNLLLSKMRKEDGSGESGSDSSKTKGSKKSRKHRKAATATTEDSDGEFGFSDLTGSQEARSRAMQLQKERNEYTEQYGSTGDFISGSVRPRGGGGERMIIRKDSYSSVKSAESSTDTRSAKESEGLSDNEEPVMTYAVAREQYRKNHLPYYTRQPSWSRRKLSDTSDNSQVSIPRTGGLLRSQEPHRSAGWISGENEWKQMYARERERIEMEHAIALQDLQTEDKVEVEDLYRGKDYLKEISAVSNKIISGFPVPDDFDDAAAYHIQRKAQPDTTSVTSDYGTMSSTKTTAMTPELRHKSVREHRTASPALMKKLRATNSLAMGELDSEFVKSMTDHFDERLRKLLDPDYEESDSDSGREGGKKSRIPQRSWEHEFYRNDLGRNNNNSFSTDKAMNREQRLLEANKIAMSKPTSSRPHPIYIKQNNKESFQTQSASKTPSSPRKVSRIEVTVTMEKRDKIKQSQTQPSSKETVKVDNKDKVSKQLKRQSKDTSSIKRDRKDQRENRRRRHTVGGNKDFPDFNKIMEYANQENTNVSKLSAMDQLKPSTLKPKDLSTWIEQERLRNSSPNLANTAAEEKKRKRQEKIMRRRSSPADLLAANWLSIPKAGKDVRLFEIESYL